MFSENAKVKLIYIQDAITSNQEIIYQGDITGFRNNLSVKLFNGFDNGQLFTIVDEDVKILKKLAVKNKDSKITSVTYYAGPEDLNSEEVVF